MNSEIKVKRKERQKVSLRRFMLILVIFLICSFTYFNIKTDSFTSENETNRTNIEEFQNQNPSIKPSLLQTHHVYANDFPDDKYLFCDDLQPWNLAKSTLIQYGNRLKMEEYQNSIQKKRLNQQDPSQLEDQQISSDSPGKIVYLTFDDGPNESSEQILEELKLYNAKATYFLIEGNIRKYPDAVKKMVESGHGVGSHSVSHQIETFYQSPETVITEMNQVRNTIKEITGIDSMLIRTPYGSKPYMKDVHKQAVTSNGYLMWDWNIDSKDWFYRDQRFVENVIVQVESQLNNPEPLVILLHEREETALQLPALLEYLASKGFTFKAIDSTIPPVAFK